MMETRLGIIGGSGLYDFEGLEDARWIRLESPFGEPSDDLLVARLNGLELVFLPRHGRGHRLSPAAINYRANIDVLKRAGVTDILSLSACGSLREDLSPGTFVVVDQFIDRTRGREKTFFGEGMVAHVSLAEPVCGRLGCLVRGSLRALGIPYAPRGTYLAMEGPQFSTRSESALYRQWGADVIGMTNMPEAALAREAEICYATVAMVTDYDCWRDDGPHVEVSNVLEVLHDNAEKARALVKAVARAMAGEGATRQPCGRGCDRALDVALVTDPAARSAEMVARLDAVAGRILGRSRGEKTR
ncbi:MAG: S-methyl-5'-thioadenosine phosphorylase [Alphaproteobacteria bacterium]|nr:MAG: S-methyl-5'-thioadenosine phosphorylase [Alphaproteobacteria bacterium]